MNINDKELLNMLNFLFDNNMITAIEYDFWLDNNTIQVEHKIILLTLALNNINEVMLENAKNEKETNYIKYIRGIIEKHLNLFKGV